jgi:hypothetical protein
MPTNRNRELLLKRKGPGPAPKRWHARVRARRLKRFDSLRFSYFARLEARRDSGAA